MTKHLSKIWFVILLSSAWFLSASNTILACSCVIPDPDSEKTLVNLEREKSQAVFSGEVLEIITPKTPFGKKARFKEIRIKVLRSWKGVETETVIMRTEVMQILDVRGSCDFEFKVGKRYLIYAWGSENEGWDTNICTRTRLLSKAKTDLQVLGKGKKIKAKI